MKLSPEVEQLIEQRANLRDEDILGEAELELRLRALARDLVELCAEHVEKFGAPNAASSLRDLLIGKESEDTK
jgi:hypothetical protein